MLRFACHPDFMFIVYDIIHRQKFALGYSLLIKSGLWNKTKNPITEFTHTQLVAAATEIKEINRCINPAILALKTHVQTMVVYAPHFYAKCFQF